MGESPQAIILVVEDHDDTRALWVAVLEAEGFRAVEATDGRTALRQIEVIKFDAVVLDLGLCGDIDGLELAWRLRARGQHCIIAASGYVPDGPVHDAVFDAYLVKPCFPEDIIRAVRRCLRSPENA